jgi:signal transduction histidine kinase
MVDIAHKNSLRLNSLINDLLDIDKLVAGKIALEIQSQPLMPLVQQALEAIAAYGEQYGVVFKLVAQAELEVAVDGGRLIQVLNNFLSNAAKFSSAGS